MSSKKRLALKKDKKKEKRKIYLKRKNEEPMENLTKEQRDQQQQQAQENLEKILQKASDNNKLKKYLNSVICHQQGYSQKHLEQLKLGDQEETETSNDDDIQEEEEENEGGTDKDEDVKEIDLKDVEKPEEETVIKEGANEVNFMEFMDKMIDEQFYDIKPKLTKSGKNLSF